MTRRESIIAALLLCAVIIGGIVRLVRKNHDARILPAPVAPLRTAEPVTSP